MRPLALVALSLCAAGCSQPEPFSLRGELDRSNWIVRSCDSDESYQVIFASTQVLHFDDLVEKAEATDPSIPVIFEFQAVLIPPRFPWNRIDTVGVHPPMSLNLGKCAPAT
jgi:hypothetical protein